MSGRLWLQRKNDRVRVGEGTREWEGGREGRGREGRKKGERGRDGRGGRGGRKGEQVSRVGG